MAIGTDHEGDAHGAATLRGVLIIVLAGLALGALHNALGQASRPPRGLAWVKQAEATISLEALQRDTITVAPTTDTAPAIRDTAAAAPTATPAPAAAPLPKSAAPSPAAPAPGTTPPAPPPAATAPTGDLPVIPDLDRPIQIELATLKKLHDAGAVLVVDARTAYEYADGHIAGAVNLPYNDALKDPGRVERLGEAGRPIAVYCSGSGCELSMDLAKLMIERGRKKVLVYEGGWPEWASMEYPAARGAQPGGR
jgi:rhodanese-related sulfurtransferase